MSRKVEGVSWWLESLGKSQGQNPRGASPEGFWPRDTIHHDTPKAFPHIFIISSSRTGKEGILSVPRDTIKKCRGHEAPSIVRVKFQYASLGCRKNAWFVWYRLLKIQSTAMCVRLTLKDIEQTSYILWHYMTLHYTTLHYTTLHYTTLNYTTLHYTSLHSTLLHSMHNTVL